MADHDTVRTSTGLEAKVEAIPPRVTRKVIAASVIGNFVEWYDFALYGFLAPFIASQFFPGEDRTTALLLTFAVFASAFVVRPVGGSIWGWLGDRWGRQRVLVLTIVIMSAGTFAIGLLPTYAAVGVLSPLLLLLFRLVQGIGASGEYSTSANFLIEYGDRRRKAWRAGFINAGVFSGVVAGAAMASFLAAVLPEGLFEAWGWRALFLLAGPFATIAYYLRYRLEDTPEFRAVREVQAATETGATSLGYAIRTQWKAILVFIGLAMTYHVAAFSLEGFLPTYLIEQVGLPEAQTFLASTVALFLLALSSILAGWTADRVGRKLMLVAGCVYFIVLMTPIIFIARQGTFWTAVVAEVLIVVGLFFLLTPMTVSMAEMFPPDVRATSSGISYNVSVAAFGGTAPYVGTWLNSTTGSPMAVAYYVMAIALISLVVVIFAFREQVPRGVEGVGSLGDHGRG